MKGPRLHFDVSYYVDGWIITEQVTNLGILINCRIRRWGRVRRQQQRCLAAMGRRKTALSWCRHSAHLATGEPLEVPFEGERALQTVQSVSDKEQNGTMMRLTIEPQTVFGRPLSSTALGGSSRSCF